MKKIFTLLSLISISLINGQNGAPAAPYYNGFNWSQTGMTLKSALTTKITSTHTKDLTYSQVWEALKITDLDPQNSSNVLLIYGWEDGSDSNITNDLSRDKDNNGGTNGQWNREHVFAQALGNPSLGQIGPGADAHMLRSCDVQRNGSRDNRLFIAGSGNSTTVGTNNWYPGDEWKGDVARILMYMYLRYGNQCLPTLVTTGSTVATDSNMPSLLLQWNAEDPVSQYEDNRNTYLGGTPNNNNYKQGNRNPFIDNPYLATVIWGGPVAQNRWPGVYLSTPEFNLENSVSIYPNPSNDGLINIETESILDEITIITINGQVVQQIKNPLIDNSNYTISNLPKGFYFLQLNSNNQSVTKKVIVN
jgi:endonuclease I